MSSTVPVPPLIPGSLNLETLRVSKANIDVLLGDVLSTLNTWKGSVKAASTANLTLSAVQTVDGVALVDGDRILVKDQTTATENGIYVVRTDAWERSDDLITGSDAAGIAVFINQGTVYADKIYVCTTDTAVVGTNSLVFATVSATQASGLSGTATLVAGTVTIANVNVQAGDVILVTQNTPGGTSGTHYSVPDGSITASTSFVVNSVDTAGVVVATDTSTVNYFIVK